MSLNRVTFEPSSSEASRDSKVERLHALLERLRGGVVVAFSGGADSALLAVEAGRILGPRALAVTADSPTLPRTELAFAKAFALKHGILHDILQTREMDNASFVANGVYRCYHCKGELFNRMKGLALERGFSHLLFGAIGDDQGDWRPGMDAARELGVLAPLMECGFTKADVRERSRQLGLETWDKPASACLSSRFPTGRPISLQDLAKVEKAEDLLKSKGFKQCRVRLMDEAARIEVDLADLPRLLDEEIRGELLAGFKELGFRFVTADLEGFRSGSLSPRSREDLHGIRRNP